MPSLEQTGKLLGFGSALPSAGPTHDAQTGRKRLTSRAFGITTGVVACDHTAAALAHKLGHYQILSFRGHGGVGQVYLAQDTRLGRKAVLKVFPREFTRDARQAGLFVQEAQAASALNHPNIVTIYEIQEFEGQYCIVTEFVDGQTLRQRLFGPKIRVSEVLDVGIQVASALTAAHEAEIAHRDITPEKIALRRDGFVKVLDVGLGRLTEALPAVWQGDIGEAMARAEAQVHYASTERKLPIDRGRDIFGLGMVLCEMLGAKSPFCRDAVGEMIAASLEDEMPALAGYGRDVTAEFERIIKTSIARNRDERYHSVKDLLIDLKNLRLVVELEARLKRTARFIPKDSTAQGTQNSMLKSSSETEPSGSTPGTHCSAKLEPPGGAVALNSDCYIVRATDFEFHSAIARQDSLVLVKGPRQVGKTSLLARGLQKAREAGTRVVLSDFQGLSARCLESIESLFQALAESMADQLDLNVVRSEIWNPRLSPSINFERFLRRHVFANISTPIVWGLDGVDCLLTCEFGTEVFGLFRSWHNKRALDPTTPWRRFTLALAYATDAHLFIPDLNQSPFNVGTRLTLDDFTIQQVEELSRRCRSPLQNRAELARFHRLLGGHPYLVHRGLHEMVVNGLQLAALESPGDHVGEVFGDHMSRTLSSLMQDPALCEIMRGVLQGQPCPTQESFYRLRSAGLISGESAQFVKPRCQLYATYLERHLL